MFLSFNEAESKMELMAIVTDIAALEKYFPELGTPREVSRLLAEKRFDSERCPWDFLVLIGYVMHRLFAEEELDDDTFFELFNRARRVLRRPLPWMCEAATDEVRERFRQVTGRELPESAMYRKRIPRRLKKSGFHDQKRYAQLMYLLATFGFIAFAPDSMHDCFLLQDMRELLCAMERPLKEAIEKLDGELAANSRRGKG